MPRPPDDEDELFQELMAQVEEAFAALDDDDELPLGDAIADATREALRAALEALPPEQRGRPDVTVLDGGRSDDDDGGADEHEAPDLHVAADDEAPAGGSDDEGRRQTRVRVFKGTRPRVSIQETPLHLEGHLRVDPGRERWQTLFRGPTPRTYRLACDGGLLEVALDGQIADRIEPGQTMDVEAGLIRVRAGTDEVAKGRYARIA